MDCCICYQNYDSNILIQIHLDCNYSICHHCLLKIRDKYFDKYIIKCPFCRRRYTISKKFISKMFELRVKKYNLIKNGLLLVNKNNLYLYIDHAPHH